MSNIETRCQSHLPCGFYPDLLSFKRQIRKQCHHVCKRVRKRPCIGGGTSVLTEGIQIPHGTEQLWPLLGLTLCLQVIGHNLLAHCQGKLSVNLSSIVCLCQPVIASLYSYIIFSEVLSLREVPGIAIVIAGVYLVKAQYSNKIKK